jgi:hypothetical protein
MLVEFFFKIFMEAIWVIERHWKREAPVKPQHFSEFQQSKFATFSITPTLGLGLSGKAEGQLRMSKKKIGTVWSVSDQCRPRLHLRLSR